jgi:deazaflavin-dependent oxidoreductase (nitroreductase family)
MDEQIRSALSRGHVIDITTTGRTTGLPRRIELVFHVFDGRIYIAGMPIAGRRRSWLANLETEPAFTFHLKGPVQADLPARARVIDTEAERRAIMPLVARAWRRDDIENMVRWSPLAEVTIEGDGTAEADAA